MGRLNKTICYLIGSIDRSPDFGVGWRKELKPFLKNLGVLVIDPTDKPLANHKEEPEDVLRNKQLILDEKYDEITEIFKPIRNIDLRYCDYCHFAIFYLDLDVFHFGSIEELSCLNRMKKPVCVVIKQKKNHSPPWLLAMLSHKFIFNNFNEMKDYLIKVDSDPNFVDEFNRWVFFNFEKL